MWEKIYIYGLCVKICMREWWSLVDIDIYLFYVCCPCVKSALDSADSVVVDSNMCLMCAVRISVFVGFISLRWCIFVDLCCGPCDNNDVKAEII